MIAHLAGRILRKSPQEVVVDVGGVGYRVLIPVSTFYRLGEAGEATELRVHTHVREDALNLYGFLSAEEQGIFERLIDVSGVGPKLAINILSGIEAAELVAALRSNDLPRLTRVPGVGRKTAERLVLELKDKLAALGPGAPASAEAAPSPSAQSVLANLGYGRAEAEKCVDRALGEARDGRFEDLLRLTLRLLSGAGTVGRG
jgi:Holliday junction DNA helicase RuvA